ncbi:hypothetical protein POM88_038320 [Heracleum sosnowskyi]|uniref:Uncharacterized protein n=1 Tax=Heracleum sosnowskyi TaxID=360622 RepID=A0AAD8HAG3_9APIA|nr:hypothetical protein POM88_038320 [Heracleum sosnowskyi]
MVCVVRYRVTKENAHDPFNELQNPKSRNISNGPLAKNSIYFYEDVYMYKVWIYSFVPDAYKNVVIIIPLKKVSWIVSVKHSCHYHPTEESFMDSIGEVLASAAVDDDDDDVDLFGAETEVEKKAAWSSC